MNPGILINAAIGLYGVYNIFQQVTSEYTSVNMFGITMNKWIYVAIWVAITFSCFSSVYKFLKARNRVR